jgi:MFS family permease
MRHETNNTGIANHLSLFGIDTAIVLFLLSAEYARAARFTTPDGLVMSAAVLAVAFLPYFFPSVFERPAFGKWAAGRVAVLALGMLVGSVFSLAMPGLAQTFPMALLIVAVLGSFAVQSYGLTKLDPAN